MSSKNHKRKRSVGAEDQSPRRSNRTNIGKNGRTAQLEKVGGVLEKKTRKNQSSVIPDAVPVNPMAPVAISNKRKSNRSKVPSQDDSESSEEDNDANIPNAPTPSFHVAGEGERFGFRDVPLNSQRGSPPHDDGGGETEERDGDRCSDRDNNEERGQYDSDPDADEDGNGCSPRLPRRLEHHDNRSDGLYFPPSTPPANHDKEKGEKVGRRSNANVSQRGDHLEDSDTQQVNGKDVTRQVRKRHASQSRDRERGRLRRADDDHRTREDRTKRRSKAVPPSQKASRQVESDDVPHDVLQRHQSKNGRSRPPSSRPQRDRSNSPSHSRHLPPSEDEIQTVVGNRLILSEDPTCLNFYPPLTRAFLRRCKLLVRAHYATRNPFITLEAAIQGVGLEILAEVHVEYNQKHMALEDKQYPHYRHSMARLLYNENGNFRSELKGAAMAAVRQHYKELEIPEGSRWTAKQGIEHVKRSASRLLQNGDWLRGPPDRDGKLRNFSHDAIKHACLAFYYKSSSRTSLRNCKEFSTAVPTAAVALVAAAIKLVLVAYQEHGQPKVPTINEDSCGRALNSANKGVKEVLVNADHGKYFKCMLQDWVQQERFYKSIDYSGESDSDFGLVFD